MVLKEICFCSCISLFDPLVRNELWLLLLQSAHICVGSGASALRMICVPLRLHCKSSSVTFQSKQLLSAHSPAAIGSGFSDMFSLSLAYQNGLWDALACPLT